jgi:enamine deaminase RidA (YjgF/YER057c/UK114 family)
MARRLPSLDALRAFEAAGRHPSFTRAAQELFITQGAVSRHVRRLESDLGVTPFVRKTRAVELTGPGAVYLARVRDAFDWMDERPARSRPAASVCRARVAIRKETIMSNAFEAALSSLGLTLPTISSPAGSYTPTVITGNLLFISGQVSQVEGTVWAGKLGGELSIAQGQEASKLCALNLLAHLAAAVGGDLGRVRRCVRLGGFINAVPEFRDHAQVMNGASELIVAVLGERGRHVRTSVGAGSLPRGAAVEAEAIFEIVP